MENSKDVELFLDNIAQNIGQIQRLNKANRVNCQRYFNDCKRFINQSHAGIHLIDFRIHIKDRYITLAKQVAIVLICGLRELQIEVRDTNRHCLLTKDSVDKYNQNSKDFFENSVCYNINGCLDLLQSRFNKYKKELDIAKSLLLSPIPEVRFNASLNPDDDDDSESREDAPDNFLMLNIEWHETITYWREAVVQCEARYKKLIKEFQSLTNRINKTFYNVEFEWVKSRILSEYCIDVSEREQRQFRDFDFNVAKLLTNKELDNPDSRGFAFNPPTLSP
jgi:hypothetical protein